MQINDFFLTCQRTEVADTDHRIPLILQTEGLTVGERTKTDTPGHW